VVGVGIVLGLSLLIGIAVGFLAIESGSIIGVLFGIVLLMVGFISFYAGIISLGYKVMADAVAKGNQMTSRQSTQPRTQSRKPATTNRRKPKGTSSSSGSAKSQSKPGVYATIADPNSSLVSKITLTDEGEIMISVNTNSGQDKIRRAKIADFHSDNNEGPGFVHFRNKK
jgi:Flp pilus assembly protein TadG